MKTPAILSILASVVVIVTVSLGAHIYRWEMITLASSVIVWIVNALIFWRLSEYE